MLDAFDAGAMAVVRQTGQLTAASRMAPIAFLDMSSATQREVSAHIASAASLLAPEPQPLPEYHAYLSNCTGRVKELMASFDAAYSEKTVESLLFSACHGREMPMSKAALAAPKSYVTCATFAQRLAAARTGDAKHEGRKDYMGFCKERYSRLSEWADAKREETAGPGPAAGKESDDQPSPMTQSDEQPEMEVAPEAMSRSVDDMPSDGVAEDASGDDDGPVAEDAGALTQPGAFADEDEDGERDIPPMAQTEDWVEMGDEDGARPVTMTQSDGEAIEATQDDEATNTEGEEMDEDGESWGQADDSKVGEGADAEVDREVSEAEQAEDEDPDEEAADEQ